MRIERLKRRLASWVRELERDGPLARMAPAIIVELQDEIREEERRLERFAP